MWCRNRLNRRGPAGAQVFMAGPVSFGQDGIMSEEQIPIAKPWVIFCGSLPLPEHTGFIWETDERSDLVFALSTVRWTN
jgi:hypothetical protein